MEKEEQKESLASKLVDPEAEVQGNWAKLIDLPEVAVVTGEENEDCIYKQKARLYRINQKQWKERGQGEAKLLRNKQSHQIRFLMRQDKTLKVVANHILLEDPYCDLKAMQNNEKALVWIANDYSEGSAYNETFSIKFTSEMLAKEFKEAFSNAKLFNRYLKKGEKEKLVFVPAIQKVEEKNENTKEEHGKPNEGKIEEKKEIKDESEVKKVEKTIEVKKEEKKDEKQN